MEIPPRLILWLAPRLMLGIALWRRLKGTESARDLAERQGRAGPDGGLWLHGASNGELASARWLVAALRAARPDLPILVTASTVTGRRLVESWEIPGIRAGLGPLERPAALRRFLARPPELMVNLEGEFYPARFAALRARGGRIALVAARMSARSHGFWSGLRPEAEAMLRPVALASPQDAESGERLLDLGLLPSVLAPVFDLKAEAIARLPRPVWAPREARARVLLAASTHEGEEAAVLDAFAGSDAFDLLILAPRHPRRGEALAQMVAARGLACSRRSAGAALPSGGKQVFLADTMGEMDLWYAAAGVCFVGGSLVRKGGHTPWEPARHGAAILSGPDTANFASAYDRLAARGAARRVEDGADLARTLAALDPGTQEAMAAAASTDLGQSALADDLVASLLSHIDGI